MLQNCQNVAVLDAREKTLYKIAWELRVTADYRKESVASSELQVVLDGLPGMLEALGV